MLITCYSVKNTCYYQSDIFHLTLYDRLVSVISSYLHDFVSKLKITLIT